MGQAQSRGKPRAVKGVGVERVLLGSYRSRDGEREVLAERVGECWMVVDRLGSQERIVEPRLEGLDEAEALCADYVAQEGHCFGTGPESFPLRRGRLAR